MLNEGTRSQTFLLEIGDMIYNEIMSKVNALLYKRPDEAYGVFFHRTFHLPPAALNLINEYYNESQADRARKLTLRIQDNDNKRVTNVGYYSSDYDEIVFLASADELKKTYDELNRKFGDSNDFNGLVDLYTFLPNMKPYLLHELQHWHDDIKSGGNYRNNKSEANYRKNVKRSPTSQKELDQYLKLPHEIIARFTEILTILPRQDINNGQDLIHFFRVFFPGWDKINQNARRSLLRKAAYYYKQNTLYRQFLYRNDNKMRLDNVKQKYGKMGVFIEFTSAYLNSIELISISSAVHLANVAKDMLSVIDKKSYLYIPVGLVDGENKKKIADLGFVKGEKIDPKMRGWLVKLGSH